jgi:hypothetical protein
MVRKPQREGLRRGSGCPRQDLLGPFRYRRRSDRGRTHGSRFGRAPVGPAQRVSYFFAGKFELDLALALDILNRELGVKRLLLKGLLEGGGGANGAFLRAGLVDELNLVLVRRWTAQRRPEHLRLSGIRDRRARADHGDGAGEQPGVGGWSHAATVPDPEHECVSRSSSITFRSPDRVPTTLSSSALVPQV